MKVNPLVVDLSHHDEHIDFAKIKKAVVVGVIHKASQGTTYVDPTFVARRGLALDAGLLWGAFHFCTGDDVKAQVDHFLKTTQPSATTLIAIDFEENNIDPSNSMSLQQFHDFSKELETRLGRLPVVYAGSYLKDKLGSSVDADLGKHRLWWAEYPASARGPKIQASWSSYWLWQYTGDDQGFWQPHRIDGVGNPCDLNDYDGTDDDLKAQWAV